MESRRDGFLSNRLGAAIAGAAVLVALALAATARAGEPHRVGARAHLELATAAAAAWAADAQLVYVESDEPVAPTGESERWGYLFFSKTLGRGRAYSIQNDEIEIAEEFPFEFDAPPIPWEWIDSAEAAGAAAAAERGDDAAGSPSLVSMFLVRGVLNAEDPDATAWGLVFEAGAAPREIVVLDAKSGKLVRRWRG